MPTCVWVMPAAWKRYCNGDRAHRGILNCAQMPSWAKVMPRPMPNCDTCATPWKDSQIVASAGGTANRPFGPWPLHSKQTTGTRRRQRQTHILAGATPCSSHPSTVKREIEKPKALPPGRSALHCSHLWHCPLFQDAAGKHVLSDVLTLAYTQSLVGCRMANQFSALCNASGCYVSGGSELIAVEAAEVQIRT